MTSFLVGLGEVVGCGKRITSKSEMMPHPAIQLSQALYLPAKGGIAPYWPVE